VTPLSSSMSRLLCANAALAGALCLGAGPRAGEVGLLYRAAPGCPGEATFRERVADLYDLDDPFTPAGAAAPSALDVAITAEGNGYLATMIHRDRDGTELARSTERNRSCNILVFVAAHRMRLAIAPRPRAPATGAPPPSHAPNAPPASAGEQDLARRLDRLEEAREAQEETIHALERNNRAQDERIAKLTRDLEELKKMNLTYTLSAGVLMTANLTSNVGPGVWVGGDLRSGPLSVGLDLRAVLPSRFEVGPFDLDLSQYVGLLTPCGRYSVFFGCGVAGVGVQVDHDSNYATPGSPTIFQPVVQLGGRVGVEVPLGESRFALRGWGEVLYSTPKVTFGYINEGVYEDRPDVSAFFGLGLVARLGGDGGQ
jgi:hypothetical protein